LDAGQEAAKTRERHAVYISALVKKASEKMHGPEENKWLHCLAQEMDNIRAAFETWMASSEEKQRALTLASDLRWFWCTQGYWREGSEWLERALNVADAKELYVPAERARALKTLGQLGRMRHGSAEAVLPLLEESLRIYETLGDQDGLADLCVLRDDDPELLERGLAICRATGNDRLLPNALQTVACNAWRNGDETRAEALFDEGATLLRRRQDPGLIGMLCEWGYMLLWRAEYRRAGPLLEECLRLGASRAGDAVSHASWILGSVRMHTGDYPGARALIEASASLRRELGACQALASTLTALVHICILEGDFPAAHATLMEAQAVSEEIAWATGLAYALCARGRLALYEEQDALALSTYTKSRDQAREQQNPITAGAACCGLGWLGVRAQDWRWAEETFTEGLRFHEAGRNERGQMECLLGIACAAAGSGQWEYSARLLGRAQAWYEIKGAILPPLERVCCEQATKAARLAMGEIPFLSAWNAGREMD
jgi:tetratricopeptide (TPR) repeat protein